MADWAKSDHPLVQAQLDRLNAMTAGKDMLGRSRLRRLLDRLGNPEQQLPPTFHIAGTNGKGSTCTYLRGAIAAQGLTAHVYTSPHLVRLNERIRLANRLITDDLLAATLGEVLDAAAGDETTFFEATTAAAFLAFARTPADACIIEVGIGGRLDATNVIPRAVACGIAQLGVDHQAYLGETLAEIAAEKAGIAKPGVSLVVQATTPEAFAAIEQVAAAAGAPLSLQGRDWHARSSGAQLAYSDANGALALPRPALAGAHQIDNAGLAIALLRAQDAVAVTPAAIETALRQARWPARLARLAPGPATRLLPSDAELWLDGAHNPAAMDVVTAHFQSSLAAGAPLHIVLAMLKDKDLDGVLNSLRALAPAIHAVPIVDYDCRDPDDIVQHARTAGFTAEAHSSFAAALTEIGRSEPAAPRVLITGSLYLAGQVLRFNQEFPD